MGEGKQGVGRGRGGDKQGVGVKEKTIFGRFTFIIQTFIFYLDFR